MYSQFMMHGQKNIKFTCISTMDEIRVGWRKQRRPYREYS